MVVLTVSKVSCIAPITPEALSCKDTSGDTVVLPTLFTVCLTLSTTPEALSVALIVALTLSFLFPLPVLPLHLHSL